MLEVTKRFLDTQTGYSKFYTPFEVDDSLLNYKTNLLKSPYAQEFVTHPDDEYDCVIINRLSNLGESMWYMIKVV